VCHHRFQLKRRTTRRNQQLWNEYTRGKQTLTELGTRHKKSHITIRRYLDSCVVKLRTDLKPQPTVIVPDTTFWGRHYGVCVFRSWNLKQNLWWNEVPSERVMHYAYGRRILEEQGWTFTAAVVDGRRGLATVFKDIPVQICHFHQQQTITKYLTRRPKTEASQALRSLALTLPKTNHTQFKRALSAWEKRYRLFYTERTFISGTNRFFYTHRSVRSAYLSLEYNQPYLFTYQRYPKLHIPNTTNTIDGYFASLKKKVAQHHGLRKDRRYRVISELLRKS